MSRNAPQLPNNYETPAAAVVSSTTGFNAGDVVYYQNNDYVSPSVSPSLFANPGTSLSFAASSTEPLPTYYGGSPVVNQVYTQAVSGANFYGGTWNKSSALLTNGNIVQVFSQAAANDQYSPYFQIVSQAGAIVVVPTQITGTYTIGSGYPNITVASLTGGGFAVMWVNGSGGTINKPCYAIYSNTGSVVIGATNDTTFGTTASSGATISIAGLPNGGFVMVVLNTVSGVFYKILTAAGVVTKAWTDTLLTVATTQSPIAITARSNSDFLVSCCNSAATGVNYTILSATGTVVLATTNWTPTISLVTTPYVSDATTLSDGTTFIIAVSGFNASSQNSSTSWVPIPTGNVVGTELSIPAANLATNGASTVQPPFVSVLGLSTGGYVIAFTDVTWQIQYAFFNAAGVAQSGTNTNGTLPKVLSSTFVPSAIKVQLLEVTGAVNLYWSACDNQYNPVNMMTAQISTSTYLPTYPSTISGQIGTLTSTGASTVSLSNSTPTGFKYTLNTLESQTVSGTFPTTVSPTTVTTNACMALSTCTLTTGQLLVAYAVTATTTIYVNVYSSAGVFVQTLTIGTDAAPAAQICSTFKIVAMASGKFAIMYASSSAGGALKLSVYSSSFARTSSITYQSGANFSLKLNASLAALTGDRLILALGSDTSNQQGFTIYSNTLTSIFSATGSTISANAQGNNISVVGNNNGGFAINLFDGTNWYTSIFVPSTNSTTWTRYVRTANPVSTTSSSFVSTVGITYTGGQYCIATQQATGSTTAVVFATLSESGGVLMYPSNVTALNTYLGISVGKTAYGSFVAAVDRGTASGIDFYGGPPRITVGAQAGAYSTPNFPSNNFSTISAATAATYGANGNGSLMQTTPLYGNFVALCWLNSSQYPVFAIIDAYTFSVPYTIQTTQASATVISPTPNTTPTTTALAGTLVAGVAATSASAGGTGQLVTNGLAQMNSSFPSTLNQAVDSTGQAVNGVKGIFKGRIANFQGN